MSKASEELEARRRKQTFREFEREWWWFDQTNHQHIHEFSAAWEILRRTATYLELYEKMRGCFLNQKIDQSSILGVIQTGKLSLAFRKMLPQSPPAQNELRDMVSKWQNMICNGWTPDKTYLEASQNSTVECVLPDGKAIRIPPTYGFLNRGIPVILPRQVTSQGHTSVSVELCEIAITSGQPPNVLHICGSREPTGTLDFMRKHGEKIVFKEAGRFIAIQFLLNHPPQAIKALVKTRLDSIERGKVWEKQPNCHGQYCRNPPLLVGASNPFGAIAFFPANQPRDVIERGFGTLIRPDRIKMVLPRIRKEWIQWESSERTKYSRKKSRGEIENDACAAWEKAARYDRIAHQSTVRPIKPVKDLDNLACAACDPFYKRNRSHLPTALPERLRNDPDFNKRIKTGLQLIKSQDDVFIPLLNLSPTPSV